MRMILTALFALWTLAACATGEGESQSASSRDCFRGEQVTGYNVVDNTISG